LAGCDGPDPPGSTKVPQYSGQPECSGQPFFRGLPGDGRINAYVVPSVAGMAGQVFRLSERVRLAGIFRPYLGMYAG
jgi:hypothetical protein